jgi:hypothetical protein
MRNSFVERDQVLGQMHHAMVQARSLGDRSISISAILTIGDAKSPGL